MEDIPKILLLLEKVIHEYSRVEQQKHFYGTDIKLTRTEIHTIVDIGNNPGIGVIALAKERGITKGAASQMVYKLCAKGLVVKENSRSSDAEVCLFLTEKGKTAFEGHSQYHRTKGKEFLDLVYSVPQETLAQWARFLEQWDERLMREIEDYTE